MQEINAKIIEQKITTSNIYISQNMAESFELNMECRAKVKTAKDEKEKKVLLNIELNIGSPNEDLKIELISDTIFQLTCLPDNYNELAEHQLVPIGRESLLNTLDDILVIMGYNKMELANKI